MESFFQKYFSTDYEDVYEEVLLERRISPCVTLCPDDLASRLKLDSEATFSPKFVRNHADSFNNYSKIPGIFQKEQPGLSSIESDDNDIDVICRGAEQGHVLAEYRVQGLKRHEMPVIGVFVDQRICPGFKYQVRRIGCDRCLWDKARYLQSIGLGYGRRLTFASDHLDNSDQCFFWSDSEPNGFAFSIQAVEVGQKFIIQDSQETEVGESMIEKIVGTQQELSMDVGKIGIMKRIQVAFVCDISYYQQPDHDLKELLCRESLELVGEVVLSKPRSSREASIVSIEKVFLPRLGHCKFMPNFLKWAASS